MLSIDNVKSELHKNITVRKGKKKSYAEIVKVCSSINNEGLSFSEKFVSKENISINNGVGEMGLSEHHGKSAKLMRVQIWRSVATKI